MQSQSHGGLAELGKASRPPPLGELALALPASQAVNEPSLPVHPVGVGRWPGAVPPHYRAQFGICNLQFACKRHAVPLATQLLEGTQEMG